MKLEFLEWRWYKMNFEEQRPRDWSLLFEIQLVVTKNSLFFFDTNAVHVNIYQDEDEWKWNNIGDPILHIELRRWADIMVICPLDANTLAKIANGLCDNLLTCIVRAWDQKKPLLFAPAMNTLMWEHVITKKQIETLTGFGYIEIPCVAKKLACADVGMGAMASVETIVEKIVEYIAVLQHGHNEGAETKTEVKESLETELQS
ncbi:phosphopantothenoylcysteine decarboxylase isoform X1 [Octopus vulgaris]|uniref:Phosphopantothenoylcysteine decarboxylase isoform X1 n=1 Tax=Octopus vulgaris TaxID=6645 RepID=A0AA36BHE2_OCTVU|nr:phosphopantothenoylcysteine decarboxylase isoform X1 [Octopus vulgaris]